MSEGTAAAGSAASIRLIVGAAIIHRGRLLTARRTMPPDLAGRWELPGGKVEAGEAPQAALIREVEEELGCVVTLGERIGGDWPLPGGRVMHVWTAELMAGDPAPGVAHDEVRWLAPDELDAVPWLDPDRPLLPLIRVLLGGQPPLTTGDSA